MPRHRSILSLILVVVATFIVGCSNPTVAKVPETYTAAQIEQIQDYIPDIVALRDRVSGELQRMIQRRDWLDVSNFVHGPLGEMRLKMTYVTRNLLPKDQERARQLTRDFFDDLVKLDQAAKEGQSQRVTLYYRQAFGDIDSFLQLVPKPIAQEEG